MAKKRPYEVSLLIEWQNRLFMQDWSIVLQTCCHPSEMELRDAIGCTSWEESTKSAVIQIVDPEKIDGGMTREFDFETVLVHELLHLKTSLLSTRNESALNDRVLHQLIDDIARAMVDAKKAGQKHD